MGTEFGQHLAQAIARANDDSVPLASRYRDQCEVWSGLCDDLSWMTTRGLNAERGHHYASFLEVGRLQAFLRTGLEGLGVSRSLSHTFADELVRAFASLRTGGLRQHLKPTAALVLASSVGALRGQVCTISEVLQRPAGAPDVQPVPDPRGRIHVIATGLLGVLAWMASVNAADIVPNLTSEVDAAAYLAAELIRVTGGQTAELAHALVNGRSIPDALLQVAPGRRIDPEAELDGGLSFS